MNEMLLRTVALGFGATLLMDLWALLLKYLYDVNGLDFRFVGRWIGHMPRGRFAHTGIKQAPPVKGETAIGWAAHYAIGVMFAAGLIAAAGQRWLEAPTLLPALVTGVVTLIAPFFVMQPAFGLGVASSRTPDPAKARMRSLVTHTVFGLGLFLTASALALF